MKAILSLAVLAVLMSCGPAPDLKRRPESWFINKDKLSDGRIDLDKKTPAEVLQIKYNNVVNLECEFRAGRPDKLIADLQPEKRTWNLVNGDNELKTIELTVDDRKLEVEISSTLWVYTEATPKKNGVDYVLKHTPVAELHFRPLDNNIQKDLETLKLFENLPTENLVFHFDDLINILSCSVKTVIAPLYEVEFQRIEKKVEPPQI
ncbi:MAG: hypothetical protein ACJ76H_09775 [Bacteriovoracaceae bacterium]